LQYEQRTVELGKRSNLFGEDDFSLKKEFDCFLLSPFWKGRVVVELTGLDNATVLTESLCDETESTGFRNATY